MTTRTKKPIDVTDLPQFLTTARLAELLGVHPATPRQWRHQKRGPAYLKLDRRGLVRYERVAVLAWLAAQTIEAQSLDDQPLSGPPDPIPPQPAAVPAPDPAASPERRR